jgi:hypothetical protein
MGGKMKFDKNDILSNPSLSVVYSHVRSLAQELAVLGQIDIASKIIDLLLSHHDTEYEFKQTQYLKFAFEHTGHWPLAIPKNARTKEVLDKLDDPLSSWPSGTFDEQGYSTLMEEENPYRRQLALCLAIAVDLCEKSGKTDIEEIQQDEKVENVLEQITEQFPDQIEPLTKQRKVWPLLDNGVIAKRLNVDNKKLSTVAKDVLETVRMRFEKGRQKCDHEGKPIKELLEMLAENTKNNGSAFYKEFGKDPPESYFHAPASEKDIKELEERLKVTLPDDYKEFLRASNGFEPVFSGVLFTCPFFKTSDVTFSDLPNILPITLFSEPTGTHDLINQAGFKDWPKPENRVQIGREEMPSFQLLTPSDVKRTVEAYKKALNSDKVNDAVKKESIHAIEDLYGSMEAFENLEWALIFDLGGESNPVGTFRLWLEDTVRMSGNVKYDSSGSKPCLAYECRAK